MVRQAAHHDKLWWILFRGFRDDTRTKLYIVLPVDYIYYQSNN